MNRSKAPSATKTARKHAKQPRRMMSAKVQRKAHKVANTKRIAPIQTPARFMSQATPKFTLTHSNPAAVTTAQRAFHPLSNHVNKPYNNESTPFEFTKESMEKINVVLKKFPANYKQSAVMPVLFIAQEQNDNWLPLAAMNKVAELLDMPPMRVYEVATFYTMYNRDKVGKFHIQVCGTTTCMTMGAKEIKAAAKKFAGVHHDGEVSKDGLFCVTEVECLGACTNAPMIQVNNKEFYENLTEETVVQVMKDLVEGKAKVGPQNGQKAAEGPDGSITLKNYAGEDFKNHFDFERIEKLVAEKKAAEAAPKQ